MRVKTPKLPVPFVMTALLTLVASTQVRGEDQVLLGAGAHTYRWHKSWLQLPLGMTIGQTHGDVVVDSRGRVIFSTDTKNAIVIANSSGRILEVWGHDLGGGSHGLRLAKDGKNEVLWVAHLNRHEAIKFTLDGRELQAIAFPSANNMYQKADEYRPTALDVAPNGDVYVVDGYGKNWLHRFTSDGRWLQSWNGSAGSGGAFNQPHGVGLDLRGLEPKVVVADRQNHQLQIFSLEGKFITAVKEDLRLPSKVVTQGEDLLVVDLKGRVTIFDKDYKVVAHLGDNENAELRGEYQVAPRLWRDGQFMSPHGAAWDKKGNLYVQDWNAHGRMSKLVRVRRPAKN